MSDNFQQFQPACQHKTIFSHVGSSLGRLGWRAEFTISSQLAPIRVSFSCSVYNYTHPVCSSGLLRRIHTPVTLPIHPREAARALCELGGRQPAATSCCVICAARNLPNADGHGSMGHGSSSINGWFSLNSRRLTQTYLPESPGR